MISCKRSLALAALTALVLASFSAAPASAETDWCKEQRARCLKRCGGKENDMDFDCRDKSGARSVSCSCASGRGFTGGDGGSGSWSGSGVGSGSGAFAGTGLGGSGSTFGVMSPDQVARQGFDNVARVAQGQAPVFFGGAGTDNGSSGGSGKKQSGNSDAPSSTSGKNDERTGIVAGRSPTFSSSSSPASTPAWAVALAVLASLLAAAGAGAAGYALKKRHDEKKAMAATSLPSFVDSANKPSAFSPPSPVKTTQSTL